MTTRERLLELAQPVYLPNVAGTIAWGMLIPTLPLYLAEQGVSLELAGVILGFAGLGSLLGGLPAGALSARFGEFVTLAAGLGGIALSTVLIGVTDTIVALLFLRLVFGACFLAARLSLQTWMTRNVDLSFRGRAMAAFGGSSRVSQLVGPLLGGALADQIGFAATFVVASLLTVAGIVPPWLHRRRNPQHGTVARADAGRGVLATIRTHARLLAKAAIIPLLVMVVREGRQVLIPLVGEDLSLSATAIGAIVSSGTAVELTLIPMAGSLMDRFGRLRAWIPAFLLMATGLLALGVAASIESMVAVIAAGALFGAGNGLSAGSMLTLSADLAPDDDTAAFLGAVATLQESGRFAGAAGVGAIAGATSLANASYCYAFVTLLVVVVLLRFVGETRANLNPAAPS